MKRIQLIIASLLVVGLSVSLAQDDQDKKEGKVIVEITKEVNGEKKTFKGEYENTEQMKADPAYREFAGDDDRFNFWFDKGGDEDIFIHLDKMKDHQKSLYRFFDGDDDEDNAFFFKHLDGDSAGIFNFHFNGTDMEEHKERMKELGIEMDALIKRFGDSDKQVFIFESKRVRVIDVDGDEFGKKGAIDKDEELELDNLSFFPNPSSNGTLKVRFTVPDEDELNIKIFNLEGKEVYSRYFERFGGTYSETIDLSDQSEGMYLLEITQGKKRLTKKIIIN